jgi:hypothetical protein
MAPKLTPEQLREQANKLLEQAAEEEARRHQLIGKKVVEYIENNFEDFNPELFKVEVRQLWSEGKVKRKPRAKAQKPIQSAAA